MRFFRSLRRGGCEMQPRSGHARFGADPLALREYLHDLEVDLCKSRRTGFWR